eukprot:RCo042301
MSDKAPPANPVSVQWYNPLKVTGWVLEALLLKDPASPPVQRNKPQASVYAVFGGPGADLAAVCGKLEAEFRISRLVLEELVRAEKPESIVGKAFAEALERGEGLAGLPTLYRVGILQQALARNRSAAAVLLEGFPYTAEDAQLFCREVCPLSGVLYVELPRPELLRRTVAALQPTAPSHPLPPVSSPQA